MRVKSLVEHVELRPSAAKVAFDRTEQALNLLLPNSDAHSSRYKSVGSVGLAVVIARDDVLPNSYNPLDPAAQGRTLFRANNRWCPAPRLGSLMAQKKKCWAQPYQMAWASTPRLPCPKLMP